MPKTLAAQVNRLQEVHECLCHVGSDAILKLIEQKRIDRSFTREVYNLWREHVLPVCTGCPAGKSHSPDAIASTSLPPATIGQAIQADILYLTSNIESGNLTALLSVDETSGMINGQLLEDKTKESLIASISNIVKIYAKNDHVANLLKTDNEPAFINLAKPLWDKLQVHLEHNQPYRHMVKIERAIQYVEELMSAALHGAGIPIPAYLYGDLFHFAINAANLTFNNKNDLRTPAELFSKRNVDMAMFTKSKIWPTRILPRLHPWQDVRYTSKLLWHSHRI